MSGGTSPRSLPPLPLRWLGIIVAKWVVITRNQERKSRRKMTIVGKRTAGERRGDLLSMLSRFGRGCVVGDVFDSAVTSTFIGHVNRRT